MAKKLNEGSILGRAKEFKAGSCFTVSMTKDQIRKSMRVARKKVKELNHYAGVNV